MEAVGHPPKLGGRATWSALVRRDEEIETAAGHIRNLGGAPRAVVEFRSGGATVDVGPDLLGLALAPSLLRSICSIPSFGNSEIRREHLVPRYQQKYQQNGRLQWVTRDLGAADVLKFRLAANF